MDARLHDFDLAGSGAKGIDASRPVSEKWDSLPGTEKWLADRHLAAADARVPYRIEGWLAETGTSVWFGAGSTGKTQLMLWMAAIIASRREDRREHVWLGGRVNGTGHVLVLTAEDTREQIVGRLRDVVEHSLGQGREAALRTCKRIHVMPFLSMSEDEFSHLSPSLFEQPPKERHWEASAVMEEVRRYVREWNGAHDDPEERIVGVVMDSATSMAGFDSLDAQATTNFFFYLGRLCERLRIFWAIIGHTPKTTTFTRRNYRATAPSRLRGVAMWTTAPRLTVEVRLSQAWREGRKVTQERQELLDWLPGSWRPDNLLVVYVAKANLKHASKSERFLARQRHGAFVDVTDMPDEALTNGSLAGWEEGEGSGAAPDRQPAASGAPARPRGAAAGTAPRAAGRPAIDPSTLAPGTALVLEVIRRVQASAADGRLSASGLHAIVRDRHADDPRAALVGTAHSGGTRDARPGAINWHLAQLERQGLLQKRGRYFHVLAAPSPGDRP
ncbi:AAA family ATPase [Sphingomonas sp. TX0522]|uniref:AAA family ATPase n=1 Tax=Sphingomonas sp. TX0522 TaxID=2479205 RepID=UPI0018DF6B55